jgi:hypothetical protein
MDTPATAPTLSPLPRYDAPGWSADIQCILGILDALVGDGDGLAPEGVAGLRAALATALGEPVEPAHDPPV